MGRAYNTKKNKKKSLIISILTTIIFVLAIVIIVNNHSKNTKYTADFVGGTTAHSQIYAAHSSAGQQSNEISSSQSSKVITDEEASEAVSKLTIEQRAALIILGAPNEWMFNGYPSRETLNKTVREQAESETNTIKLSRVSGKLAANTSVNDQVFYISGEGNQGLGGVVTQTYAFGREKNRIYYYISSMNLDSKNAEVTAEPLGEANIDQLWKMYFNVGDMPTVNKIASHIVIE